MPNFRATFYDGTGVSLSGNGTTLSIGDYSNYQDYTDQAQSGGATTIVLAADASSYDDFYNGKEIELLSGSGAGDKQIITNYDGTTKTATVFGWTGSNPDSTTVYEIGERGHLQSYFSDFRQIYITTPSLVYVLSSLGDGDATTVVPSAATLPITDTYTYSDGDGVYYVQLYSLPTWSAAIAYLAVSKVCVYYGGKMWHLLKNDTGTTPGTDATVWEEVTELDDLETRYISENRIAIYCDLLDCWRRKIASAMKPCNPCNSEVLIRDLDVQKAFQLKLAIDAIPALAALDYWTSEDNYSSNVTDVISFARQLCCCGRV